MVAPLAVVAKTYAAAIRAGCYDRFLLEIAEYVNLYRRRKMGAIANNSSSSAPSSGASAAPALVSPHAFEPLGAIKPEALFAISNSVAVTESLLSRHGASTSSRTTSLDTALHFIVRVPESRASLAAVVSLLMAGADPSAVDDNGCTPRDVALHHCRHLFARLLALEGGERGTSDYYSDVDEEED